MRPTSPLPIYVGIGVTLVGFLLIGLAWAQIAGRQDVPEQLPYLAGAGLAGIGLILVGLTLTAIQSRRIEGAERARQIQQVTASVSALHELLAPTDDDRLSMDDTDPDSADDAVDGTP